MGTTLSGKTPATTFDALIKVGDNSALSASLKTISDGEGNDSPLKLSTSAVGIGSITNVETEINGKQATLVSGSSIKTINSTSVLGSGDIVVQATLVSGSNIKTINSSSLLGSGDVEVQETLVSGTNIKTINSTSLLGSGDISISASAGGSDTQIQFNDTGAFGADSLFNWDNTNKRLGVGETTPTARVHIKGEGATSGTTSLLVQNSDANDMLKVTDNGGTTLKSFGASNTLILDASSGVTGFQMNSSNGQQRFRIQATSSATRFTPNNNNDAFTFVGNGIYTSSAFDTADSSAKLEVKSTTQGFLPPRMTTTQVEAIEPTAGLIVYDTSTNKLQCYDGGSWNNLF